MAGVKDPIKLTPEQFEMITNMEGVIRDLDFELDRAARAGLEEPLELERRKQELQKRKRQIEGLKRVYGPNATG